MTLAEAEKPPDELIAGKYRVTRLVGRGGMGSVWEGVHSSLGTRVAVKFIETEYAQSQEARSRFENEARAAAKLRSKHVVQVYDHGVTSDGRPFIVMEFLVGEPLDRRLDRVGRLSPAETAKILQQVCRALGRAHEAGIVHRDLKPENIFLVWDEEDGADIAKVVDFGIAKFTDGSMGVSSATRTGSVLGTPYYMSPEQARGLRSVDFRSDLWSVGVIAYRCLTGELPFTGEAIGDLLVKICTSPLPVPSQRVPGLPPAFDAWFAKSLEREPSSRFPSALAASDALAAAFGLAPRAQVLPRPGSYPGAEVANAVTGPATPIGLTPPTGNMPYQSSGVQPTAAMPTPPAGFTGDNMTGAPLTTPTLNRRASRAPLFAIIAVACLLLGVAIAAVAKLASRGASQQQTPEQTSSLGTEHVAASAPPDVVPAPADSTARAHEGPAPSAVTSVAAPVASAPATKPEPHKALTAKPSARPATRPPQVKPELPKPPKPSRPAGGIDVGY